MNNYLKEELIRYAKNYIKNNVHEKFYYKQNILDEIENVGLNEYSELVEDGDTKFLDLLEWDIQDSIDKWCEEYAKYIDKELLLNLTTKDITNSSRHTRFNNVPDEFPYPIKLFNKWERADIQLSNMLGFLKIPIKELIEYTDEDIENMPIYQKLKEENKKIRQIEIKNYINDIKEYLEKEVE